VKIAIDPCHPIAWRLFAAGEGGDLVTRSGGYVDQM
jgi:hypothetical protein